MMHEGLTYVLSECKADEVNGENVHDKDSAGEHENSDEGIEVQDSASGDSSEGDMTSGIFPGTDHDDDWSKFLWKRVRIVEVSVELSKCTLRCDCYLLERTCYMCRHILCLLKAMHGNSFGLVDQPLSARLLKSRYWGIFHTAKKIPVDDAVPFPAVSRATFDAWMYNRKRHQWECQRLA